MKGKKGREEGEVERTKVKGEGNDREDGRI